jgi:hypothetical protein
MSARFARKNMSYPIGYRCVSLIAVSLSAASVMAASPLGDPCALLSTKEVAAFVAGANSPRRDRSREEYGIYACEWKTPRGRFGVEIWKSEPNAVESEAHGLVQGFVDPLKADAKKNVRLEKIAGVGEQAIAVVEQKDSNRGILNDVAMLLTQNGEYLVVMGSDDLARGDRAAVLAGLRRLGIAAAARL